MVLCDAHAVLLKGVSVALVEGLLFLLNKILLRHHVRHLLGGGLDASAVFVFQIGSGIQLHLAVVDLLGQFYRGDRFFC